MNLLQVLQKLPALYTPDEYSFIFTAIRKNCRNDSNSLIIDDLDKVREEHPEFDGKAKALMSEQIHKQALDSVKHVHEENNQLKKLFSKKDKSEDDAKAERDTLKKQVAELQKEVKKLFKSRLPGVKSGDERRIVATNTLKHISQEHPGDGGLSRMHRTKRIDPHHGTLEVHKRAGRLGWTGIVFSK